MSKQTTYVLLKVLYTNRHVFLRVVLSYCFLDLLKIWYWLKIKQRKGMEWRRRWLRGGNFPLNFDQNKYELLSKTLYMKNYKSYSYYCNIKLYCFRTKNTFHYIPYFLHAQMEISHILVLSSEDDLYQGKVNTVPWCTKKIKHHSVLWNYHLSSCRRQYNCYSFILGAGKISIFLFHNFS